MPSRPPRTTLLVAAVGALVLAASVLVAAGIADTSSSGSPQRGDEWSAQEAAAPVVARIDQRDRTLEQASQQRLTFLAVLGAVLAAAVVLRSAVRDVHGHEEASGPSVSPFSGRAPPRALVSA